MVSNKAHMSDQRAETLPTRKGRRFDDETTALAAAFDLGIDLPEFPMVASTHRNSIAIGVVPVSSHSDTPMLPLSTLPPARSTFCIVSTMCSTAMTIEGYCEGQSAFLR